MHSQETPQPNNEGSIRQKIETAQRELLEYVDKETTGEIPHTRHFIRQNTPAFDINTVPPEDLEASLIILFDVNHNPEAITQERIDTYNSRFGAVGRGDQRGNDNPSLDMLRQFVRNQATPILGRRTIEMLKKEMQNNQQ